MTYALEHDHKYWLAAIVDSSADAIVSKTLDGVVTSWNASAERIFGYTADEIVGRSILAVIPPERHHEEADILARIRAGQRLDHFETRRLRKGGGVIDVSLTISPIRNESGAIIGVSKIARDITEQRQNQELKNILSREINHRSRNLLAVVQSLLRQSEKEIPPDVFVARALDRIQGLSLTHELIVRSDWKGISVGELVEVHVQHLGPRLSSRIKASGPKLRLSPAGTQAMGLALHELCANSRDYGALASEGTINVRWDGSMDAPTFSFFWTEQNGATSLGPGTRARLSWRILERMVPATMQGSAELSLGEKGMIWTVFTQARSAFASDNAA